MEYCYSVVELRFLQFNIFFYIVSTLLTFLTVEVRSSLFPYFFFFKSKQPHLFFPCQKCAILFTLSPVGHTGPLFKVMQEAITFYLFIYYYYYLL